MSDFLLHVKEKWKERKKKKASLVISVPCTECTHCLCMTGAQPPIHPATVFQVLTLSQARVRRL